ncbi:MAG TPA: hypothetical protein VFX04_02550 [Rhodanobacteraceae bacterium]|nr:hypothetical protein [Rhodanobacteraceae bacterium]
MRSVVAISSLASAKFVRGENRLGYGLQMRATDGLAIAIGQAVRVLADFFQGTVDGRDPVQIVREQCLVVGLLFKAVAVVDGIPGFVACRCLERVLVHTGRIAAGNQLRAQLEQTLALAGDECVVEMLG